MLNTLKILQYLNQNYFRMSWESMLERKSKTFLGQICLNSENRGRIEEKAHLLFSGHLLVEVDLWYSLYYREGALGVWETGRKCMKTKFTCQVLGNAHSFPRPYIMKKMQFTIRSRIKKTYTAPIFFKIDSSSSLPMLGFWPTFCRTVWRR